MSTPVRVRVRKGPRQQPSLPFANKKVADPAPRLSQPVNLPSKPSSRTAVSHVLAGVQYVVDPAQEKDPVRRGVLEAYMGMFHYFTSMAANIRVEHPWHKWWLEAASHTFSEARFIAEGKPWRVW